jgi:hypothetical protein
MEYLNDDYAKKLGEIEMFMDFSDGVIKAADLQNLAYDAAANEKLDQWELRLNESLLGEPKAQATGVAMVPAPRARVAALHDDLDRLLAGRATRSALSIRARSDNSWNQVFQPKKGMCVSSWPIV